MILNLSEREAVILAAMFSIGSCVVHADKGTAESFVAKVRFLETTTDEINSISVKMQTAARAAGYKSRIVRPGDEDAAIRAGYAAREVRPGGIS